MKLIFDIETTGLSFDEDEILQLGIIDEEGNTLFDDYFKPISRKEWPEAQNLNHITPEMVAGKKNFSQRIDEVQSIFDKAEELIAYNSSFDMAFLRQNGIVFPDVKVSDPMIEFAPVYGEWNPTYGSYKWQKLTTAAGYYGYKYQAHDALEDVRATLFVYKKLQNETCTRAPQILL